MTSYMCGSDRQAGVSGEQMARSDPAIATIAAMSAAGPTRRRWLQFGVGTMLLAVAWHYRWAGSPGSVTVRESEHLHSNSLDKPTGLLTTV